MAFQETRCSLLQADETTLECDEKCKELKNEEEKVKEEREAAIKAEEMRKQQVCTVLCCSYMQYWRVAQRLELLPTEPKIHGSRHFEPGIRRSLPAANGDLVEHWGDKGGEERNCRPYLTKPMAQDKCAL